MELHELRVCLTVCPSVCPSVCLFVCLSACMQHANMCMYVVQSLHGFPQAPACRNRQKEKTKFAVSGGFPGKYGILKVAVSEAKGMNVHSNPQLFLVLPQLPERTVIHSPLEPPVLKDPTRWICPEAPSEVFRRLDWAIPFS